MPIFRFTLKNTLFLAAIAMLAASIDLANQLSLPNTYTSSATIGANSKNQQEQNSLFQSALKQVRPYLVRQVKDTTGLNPAVKDISFYFNLGNLDLYVKADSPELASTVAQSYARKSAALISEWDLDRRFEQVNHLSQRLVESGELELLARNNLANDFKSQKAFREEEASREKISAMQTKLISFQTERDGLEAALEVETAAEKIVEADAQIMALSLEIIKQEKVMKKLSQSLKPAHPEMVFLRELIVDLKKKTAKRKENLIVDFQSDLEVLDRKMSELELEIDAEQIKLVELSKQVAIYLSQMEGIENLVASKRELKRELDRQSLQAAEALPLGVVTVPAMLPLVPDFGFNWTKIGEAALLGLAVGLSILLAQAILARRISGAEEAEFYFSAEVIGDIPVEQDYLDPAVTSRPTVERQPQSTGESFRLETQSDLSAAIEVGKTNIQGKVLKVFGRGDDLEQDNVHLFPYFDQDMNTFWSNPKIVTDEAFRNLAKDLISKTVTTGLSARNILVTSAVRGEGKSHVSHNLAKTLARADYSTLIVECNLQKVDRGVSELRSGLTDYLRAELEPERIIRKTGIENLHKIHLGQLDQDAQDLVCSKRMWELANLVSTAFDFVIYDGPAVLEGNDSLILSDIADASVMVVDTENTDKRVSKEALEKLRRAEVEFSGIVLNNSAV